MTTSNFNLYWLCTTILLIWFLFYHAPPLLQKRFYPIHPPTDYIFDIPFFLHLLGSYGICLACIINAIYTPSSYRPELRWIHHYIGRMGLVCGIFSFILGFYCSWYPYRPESLRPPLSFAIAITLGGCAQLYLQYQGYYAIQKYYRIKEQIMTLQQHVHVIVPVVVGSSNNNKEGTNMKSNLLFDNLDHRQQQQQQQQQQIIIPELEQQKFKALKEHIVNMIGLFVMGCGAPAFIRLLGQLIDGSNSSVTSRPTTSSASDNQDSSTGNSRWASYISAFYFILAVVLLNVFYIRYVRRVISKLTTTSHDQQPPNQNIAKSNNQQSIHFNTNSNTTYRSIS